MTGKLPVAIMNFGFINVMHGWTTPEKAQQLYELTLKAKPEVAMEIGVWGGRGTIPIALALKQLLAEGHHGKVIAVDPWSKEESAKGQVEPASAEWWSKQDHEMVMKSFLWHVDKHGVHPYVEVRRETSAQTALPREIGLLIIDGNHGEQALADAQKFAPNVKLGGYLLLDDLDWSGGYVRQAEDFIKKLGFAYVKLIDGQSGLYQRMEMGSPEVASPPDFMVKYSRNIPEEPARLTVAYITARREPEFQWFFDSLANQLEAHDKIKVIIVDLLAEQRNKEAYDLRGLEVKWVEPKPTIWQGKYRITKQDWWAASNARNTAICLCETDWIAFCDDRCVLLPSWLGAVKKAIAENYIVVGSYEKRSQMVVEQGFIKGFDKLIGADPRLKQSPQGMKHCPYSWFFGCASAMPLETALAINGFEEGCDGMGMEDSIFGLNLRNAGYAITFDPQMRMIEDRTPGEIASGHGIDDVMRRESFKRFDHDKEAKDYKALARFGSRKTTEFTPDLKMLRKELAQGLPFPIQMPEANCRDWFNGQLIAEL